MTAVAYVVMVGEEFLSKTTGSNPRKTPMASRARIYKRECDAHALAQQWERVFSASGECVPTIHPVELKPGKAIPMRMKFK